ncbi:MAG: tryptophan synthase subunit alpha [Oscillospiraceae bacterium]|nr:tryptophan synthase subunit alpha [Oscillospiraceae bacterium]
MNKIITYITAGEPNTQLTCEYIHTLAEQSDFVMVGLPFSDPVADSPVVEAAFMRALAAGVTTDCVFGMTQGVAEGKVVISTYANPVFIYGYDRFFAKCKACGVFGVLIPDLPHEERGEIQQYAKAHGIHLITMIMPSSVGRVKMLAENASGFIYLIAATDEKGNLAPPSVDMLAEIRMVTDVPVYVGGMIATTEQIANARNAADGVVIGNAMVEIIVENGENASPMLREFIEKIV